MKIQQTSARKHILANAGLFPQCGKAVETLRAKGLSKLKFILPKCCWRARILKKTETCVSFNNRFRYFYEYYSQFNK